jgi:hypothetical protein
MEFFKYLVSGFKLFVKYVHIQLNKKLYVRTETEFPLLSSKRVSFDPVLSNSIQFSYISINNFMLTGPSIS